MLRNILLAALTLLSLVFLAACGATGPEATQAPAAEPAATLVVAAEAEPTAEPAEEPTAEPAEEPAEASEEETAARSGEATYTVDTAASSILWYGSKPIGASESGTVDIAEGQLNFIGSELVDGVMVIDMQTIATTSQTGGMAQQLLDHLSSDDFFGVATYPTATLLLKSAEPTEVENQYLVTADLTIKEIIKEIEFITDVVVDGEMITANADIVVDRADFDVRYGSGSFFSNLGNDLISDEMEITVVLVATR
jgi:polyisoprenoid-binding protein YceI